MTSTLISNIVIAMKEVSGSFVNSMGTSKEFTVEGFKYRILSKEDRTVSIVGVDDSVRSQYQLKISARILYENNIYTIVSIDNNAFDRCNFLSISIPPTIKYIGENTLENFSSIYISDLEAWCKIKFERKFRCEDILRNRSLFLNKQEIINLVIPNSVTEIRDFAFCSFTNLNSVTISSVTKIGEFAFSGCKNMILFKILGPLTEIGKFAFFLCKSLLSIELPNSLIKIASSAFFFMS
jgi:hypothetical protein